MSFDLNKLLDTEILVVGDVMLDQYIWGSVSRISPEAPVPVVKVGEKTEVLGGAGNVAANLSGLGCSVTLLGLRGDDETGRKLEDIIEEKGIKSALLPDTSRPTITKTRIMAQKQQLFRLDEEKTVSVPESIIENVLATITDLLPKIRVVILSDYGKGLLQSPGVCRQIINECSEHSIPVIVDPKGTDWERYEGATCVTPNTAELELVLGHPLSKIDEELKSTANEIRNRFNLSNLLLTRGPDGMCLIEESGKPFLIPTRAKEVYDVSGAGDTVISTLAAGIAAGFSFRHASELANTAAGVVVGKIGTQPVSRTELDMAIKTAEQSIAGYIKIASLSSARTFVESWKTNGETIVFTNGCFDLLHPGHVDLLHKSRELGNRLVVGLNSDSSVRRLKGKARPIVSEQDRAAILSALGCVDLVVIFEEDTPLEIIGHLKPDILVKGADYKPEEVVGKDLVESYGGKVRLVPLLEGHSTTGITKKILDC